MGYDRNIVTKISPEMEQINSFLKGPFQESLNGFGLRYEFESWRNIKTGKTYDDQIFVGVKRKFWDKNIMVADIRRNVADDKSVSLEIRVLNPEYSEVLEKTVGQYQNISVKLYK